MKRSIAIAEGDGIGPEVMRATLRILSASGAELELHKVDLGEKVSMRGIPTGIEFSAWEILHSTQVLLKAPTLAPQGPGFRVVSSVLRAAFSLYANIRPCVSYYPFIATKHPDMNVVFVRELEEDLYTGMEYRQTPNVCQSTKLISRSGCERVIRYAFEYARLHGRKKVTCLTKENLLRFSDRLFFTVFEELAKEYPDILNEHWIVDIGAAKLADTPEEFDLIVLPNLYGDILADIGIQIAGSFGICGSGMIGEKFALFEPLHGPVPHLSEKNLANPSALLLSAIEMLVHIRKPQNAECIHNAWLKTLEDGIHTYDLYQEGRSTKKVGTEEFTHAIIQNLGKKPNTLPAVKYPTISSQTIALSNLSIPRHLRGIDITIYHKGPLSLFFSQISHINIGPLKLKMIFNRGVRVWPNGYPETFCIEQWCCRFTTEDGRTASQHDVIQVIHAFDHVQIEVIKTEFLYLVGDALGYTEPS